MNRHHTQDGFSLVELSIVLVILGLLTGGILAGQSLIRAAELRSVSADIQRFQSSIYSFRDKYFALPGDMTNATRFWGVRAGTGSDLTCHQTINTTTNTCNGNGDGRMDQIASDVTFGERFLAWQHMAYAGLVEGSFTGASGSAAAEVRTPGTNMPRSKLSNTGFLLAHTSGPQSGSAFYFDGAYGINTMHLHNIAGHVMKPEEMWNLDTKIDDGKPATGAIFTYKSTSAWQPGCATTDVVSTAEYALTNSGTICSPNIGLR